MSPTLEQLLRTKIKARDINMRPIEVSPEFRVAVQRISQSGVHFIIHPVGVSGPTLDLVVNNNEIKYLGE